MVILLAWGGGRAMPEDELISWGSPKLLELEKQWRSLEEAYDKTPEKLPGAPGKDKATQFSKMLDRLLRKSLSDRELGQLARSPVAIPEQGIARVVTGFMASAFTGMGDRDSLVELLSRRCPGRVGGGESIEFCLAFRGRRLTHPILILGDAYSRCQSPATRHDLAAAVRRAFGGMGISGKDDAEYVKNAMQWYEKEKEHLVVNVGYARNETLVPMETYQERPELYDGFPGPLKRECLFEKRPISQASMKPKPEVSHAELPIRHDSAKVPANSGTREMELVKLAGTWEVIEATHDGEPALQEEIRGFRFVFRDNTLKLCGPAPQGEDEFQLRIIGTPQSGAVDLVQMVKGALPREQTTPLIYDLQEETTPAIHEVRGDTLRMCLPLRGAMQRPTSFAAEKGSRETSFVLRRAGE